MNLSTSSSRTTWAPLAVLMIGTFMFVLDFFVVNVALPSIRADLHASDGTVEWVVSAYALTMGALLVAGGRLGDRIGPRTAFGWGLAAFTLASAVCALAPAAAGLVAGRVGQGLAAAVMAPAILSVLGRLYTGERRTRAISCYAMVLGVAAVSGQLIGGALIDAGLGWRSLFWLNVPVGVVGLALLRVVPPLPGAKTRQFDLVGVVLLGLGVLSLLLPLVEGREQGWPVWSWVLLGCSPALLLAFALHERRAARRGRYCLFDPVLLEERGLAAGLTTQAAFWCQQAAAYLFLALYLQQGRGLSPLESGLMFGALAAGYLVTSLKAPALTVAHGRGVLLTGAVVAAAGDVLLALATRPAHGSVLLLLPGLVVLGAGQGLCITPLTTVVLGYATPETTGAVSGALSTTQQVGNAVGVGVIGVVFYGGLAEGYGVAFGRTTVAMAVLLCGVAALTRLLPRRRDLDSPATGDSRMGSWTSGSASATSRG